VRRSLVIDRATAAALVAGIVVLDLLIFSAGWLVGRALTPRPPLPVRPNPPAPGEGEAAVFKPPANPRAGTGGGALSRAAGEGRGGVFLAAATQVSPLADIAAFTPPPKLALRPPAACKVSLDVIHEAALSHSLPPSLVEAVARVESGLNPKALSPKGARGLMQVMPATGRRFGIKSDRLFEPEHNLAAGAAYLAWLMDRYDDNLDLALAAYNAGEGAVDDYGGIPPYRETQDYVRRVKAALTTIEARAAAD
jgi:soluble lytic murein transglycosylase-like protein